ncbi:MAG: isoleucine--tRNA ligase [Acidimicrobiia bacterium]|nr:MAG: isoleucine--tRNA ligase [Acidimicrobiia bacterium]
MTNASTFQRVGSAVDFPALDGRILDFWDSIDAFVTSVEARDPSTEYTFYDGPPFATGSPHYGHLLQGVVKDIVPRYWTMRGHRVERRFGWDTHGLPVEMEVEKQLGVSGPREIHEIGVDTFNEACRAMVNNITDDWYEITRRLGRWVDFENDYKTMDVDFMESVWWVFGQLWERGLVYRDFKVLPYSYGAATPLSNFEANLDYRDVDDPAITVALPVTTGSGPASVGDHLVIWTTTPWTLPGNLAIAVGNDIEYSRVRPANSDNAYWVATELVGAVFGDDNEVTATAPGSELVGTSYEPPFDDFLEKRNDGAFVVIPSDHVTVTEGTGLVHMAPAYGEEDFRAFQDEGISVIVDPIDAQARFTSDFPAVEGMGVKDADKVLIDLLETSGKLLDRATINHSYPFCWRTGTPLIYKAIPTWFVAVTKFRDRMVEVNKDIRWVPEAIGRNRFGNWLEDARDWAISRNRYWGSAIPVWQCSDCDEQVAVSSIDELFELSGVRLTDLHKQFVDPVTWDCTLCDGTMKRVPDVLDCWFESGSMPFAQIHYPFENEQRFEQRFPADFIAEGLDQTRGWFYTLLVLSTAIRDEAPFQNCIVTGMVLAEDGRKMSKSLKNYPDPIHVLDAFGADALRAYLINSPIVRGEPLRFSEDGVREVVRTVLLPLWNSYSFFTTYAQADGITAADLQSAPRLDDRPEIDRWIISVLQSLVADVNREMEAYRLFAVVPPIIDFVGDLTNWYIRRSRRRFWAHRGATDDSDKMAAFATLHDVLVLFSRVAAPIIPFVTEEIYQGLARAVDPDTALSVHHTDYPEADHTAIDEDLERSMATVRTVVNLGRGLRKRHDLRVRQPLASVTVVTRSPDEQRAVADHSSLIREELNVASVEVHADEAGLVDLHAKANFKELGPRYGKNMKMVAAAIAGLDHDSIAGLLDGDEVAVDGFTLTSDDIVVTRVPRPGTVVATDGSISVALDTTLTEALRVEGIAREIVNRLQGLRRKLDLDVTDRINVVWSSPDDAIAKVFEQYAGLISGEVLADSLTGRDDAEGVPFEIDGLTGTLTVTPSGDNSRG